MRPGAVYVGDLKCQLTSGAIVDVVPVPGQDLTVPPGNLRVHDGTPRAWALATSAITFEFNGARHDLLSGELRTPVNVQDQQARLSTWWDVDSRESLVETLRWLRMTGHRAQFEALGRDVDRLSDDQFELLERSSMLDTQQLHAAEVARLYHRHLGSTGILAWDLVRYIHLCRWGFLAGYLSEREAWEQIMPVAAELQQSFGSWEEMQRNFLIGRDYWSLAETRKTGKQFQSIYERLLGDSHSVWSTNPWNLPLGGAAGAPPAATNRK